MAVTTLPRISVKLPLEIDPRDGPYASIDDLTEVVRQNFKNLILTVPGERVMLPDFGVGLHQFLFEMPSQETVEMLRQRIIEKTSQYLEFVTITNININFDPDRNSLLVRVEYFIQKLNQKDFLELSVESPI